MPHSSYHGKKGHAYISDQSSTPRVSFSLEKTIETEGIENKTDDELKPTWSVEVADIRESVPCPISCRINTNFSSLSA